MEKVLKKKKKKKITRTFESEFCMGGQTRTDILPYKFLIPVFGFFMSVTCTALYLDPEVP